jgi:hypothetical protein
MRQRIFVLAILTTLLACIGIARCDEGTSRSDVPAAGKFVKTQLEVDALSTLNDLNLTAEQLSAISDLSADTAGAEPAPPAEVNANYAAALASLREAILTRDEDKIDAAQQHVSDLEDQLDIDTPTPELTDAACAKVADAMKLLSPHQVVQYFAQNADDFPDVQALLAEAIDECRGLPKDQFTDLRDDVADEISTVAGFKPTAAGKPPIHGKIVNFLNKVHGLSDDDFKSQRSALVDEGKALVKDIPAISGIRNWFEHELAELLANPQLPKAIEEYQKTLQ